MFTGIIEETGVIRSLANGQSSAALTIGASSVLKDIKHGDSIAVNGVCLTVTGFTTNEFTVDVMLETLQKTNLGCLAAGTPVNLERALAVGGRLGGHLVTGHVDATGAILELKERGIATEMWVTVPVELERFLIPQGSVAVDGVSLTIASLRTGALMVGLVPHTKETTTLVGKKIGDLVNIETDLLGKYVSSLLQSGSRQEKKEITPDFLIEHGFL